MKHGMRGYGIYWAIIELLYKEPNGLKYDCDSLAFALHDESKCIASVLNDFDLFVFDSDFFTSQRVQDELNNRNDIAIKRSTAAKQMWKNQRFTKNDESKCNANAEQMHTRADANASNIENSIVKNKRVENSKELIAERSKILYDEINAFIESHPNKYPKTMYRAFYDYFSAPLQKPTKNNLILKDEMKTWSLSGRLATWYGRDKAKYDNDLLNEKMSERANNQPKPETKEEAAANIAFYFGKETK